MALQAVQIQEGEQAAAAVVAGFTLFTCESAAL